MLRPCLSLNMSRNRLIKQLECTFSSSAKFKKSKTAKGPKQKSAAMTDIDSLTPNKRAVSKDDVDNFLKKHPMQSLNAAEVSALVRSLGKSKYPFDPPQLTQLSSALNSAELQLNAHCLGNIFYGLRGINQRRQAHLPRETTELLKSLLVKMRARTEKSVDPAKISMVMFGLQNFTCTDSNNSTSQSDLVKDIVKEVTNRVSAAGDGWSGRAVGTALYGLRGSSSDVDEVRSLLATLVERFDSVENDFPLNPQELGNSLYGLQRMSSAHEEVTDMLSFIRDKLISCNSRPFKGQEISNFLYGMQNMSSDEPEVRNLIHVLCDKIDGSFEELSGQEIGNSLYGLRNMSSEHSEVRCLLSSLRLKVDKSSSCLSPQEMSNALYGLRNMGSEYEEVRLLVGALLKKMRVDNTQGSFKAREISMALYGLKSMSAESAEVRSLLKALTGMLHKCTETFSAQNVGNSLYGLRNMSSSTGEVRALIRKLNTKVMGCSEVLNEQDIGISLYGFQNMSTDHEEVRSLLSSVSTLIEQSPHADLTSQAMGNALYGLRSMSSHHDEALRVLEVLHSMVMRSSHTFTAKSVSNLYGLKNMTSETFQVRNLLTALSEKISQSDISTNLTTLCVANALGGLQSMSSSDAEVRQLLKVLEEKCFGEQQSLDWDQDTLGGALYGMKNMSSEHQEVRRLLGHVTEGLKHIDAPLTAAQLSKVLFSMKEMSSSTPEVREVLSLMGQRVRTVELDSQAVANCLYGLQNMSCNDDEVREFIRQLCDNMESSSAVTLLPQAIGNSLHGFKSMSCEHDEVRRCLVILCDAAAECKQPFDAQALSTAFVGLRGCHDRHVEVADMFFVLKQKLEAYKGGFTPLQMKNMFSGLRGMSSSSKDMRQLLALLGDKLRVFVATEKLDGGVVGEALYGLQRMSVEHTEVRAVLNILSSSIPPPDAESAALPPSKNGKPSRRNNTTVGSELFDVYSLGASLYGLASISQINLASTQDQSIGHIMDRMKSSGVIFHLINSVLAHGAQMTSKIVMTSPSSHEAYSLLDDAACVPPSHYSTLLRSLNLIEEFNPQLPSSSQQYLQQMRSDIETRLNMSSSTPSSSRAKERSNSVLESIAEKIRSHFAGSCNVVVEVASKDMDSFETDITVSVSKLGQVHVLDIEVESHRDDFPTKRRFAFLRDKYFESKNDVDVLRVRPADGHVDRVVAAAVQKVTEILCDELLS